MPKPMNPCGFLPPLPRLFTVQERDAYELIHFKEYDGDSFIPFASPDNWSRESCQIFADEACFKDVPLQRSAIEENTVPSWLWKHSTSTQKTTAENSAQQVFDRVTGAAIYKGWKHNLFADEFEARHFYDEIRYALAMRFFAFEPRFLSTLGIEWAYGELHPAIPLASRLSKKTTIDITNTMIDAVVSGSTKSDQCGPWHHALDTLPQNPITVTFVDTIKEWELNTEEPIPVLLDIMAYRHNDGSINIDRLRHAVQLIVTFLDLHDPLIYQPLAIGFSNIAPLLVALGLPYDSAAARMTTAALHAIVSAQAYITSSQLASLRGVSPAYNAGREPLLRSLRNHRRAVYGDHTDYEKVSVLPQPLTLTPGLDLTLVASAQRLWDEVLTNVRHYGLRHTQVTSTLHNTSLTYFMDSFTQGIDPMPSLTVTQSDDGEVFTQKLHPSVAEALIRLSYTREQNKTITAHIAGYRSLEKAPFINHKVLRECGFDDNALLNLEHYLPYVTDINLAFTPWILGASFCHKSLKISAKQLERQNFCLLKYLGFSAEAIQAANTHCYGHGNVTEAPFLRHQHKNIFVCHDDLAPEAHIRMAASVQSFVSGHVALSLRLPLTMTRERREALILSAWRQGVKTITLAPISGSTLPPTTTAPSTTSRHSTHVPSSTAFLHTQKPHLPTRQSKPKAVHHLVGMATTRSKSAPTSKGKR